MATKITVLFRPQTLPFLSFHFPPRSSTKPLFLFSTAVATTSTSTSTSLSLYGPSLHKGHSPIPLELPKHPSENSSINLDESAFTRVFDLSALRVPSDLCYTLENRLRGHLLNWPRINNIARVPGDEIDPDFKTLILHETETDKLVKLNRVIYGNADGDGDGETMNSVLYRDKLSKSFNSTGYLNFRNLAKISRPKKKKERDDGGKRQGKGVGRNDMALVEVIEDDSEGNEDFSRLLGEDVPRWRGSTRLLLLDERYSDSNIDELPEAIKVVLNEHDGQSKGSSFEFVKCKLTLFYDYWQLNEILEALLPKEMIIPSGFEMVGHIAHLNLKDEHLQYKNLIAKVILDKNKPKIRTVVNKVDAIQNNFRTMQLEVLAGNNSLVTTLVENGLRFHVDLAKVYWNSRLATERQRLLSCFSRSDVVCDVFAGVGPIAIAAAKKVKHVYANDLNPCAVEYLERNCVLNKLEKKIEVFNMDGRRFIEAVFASRRAHSITHVIMNLPNNAAEFLDAFRGIFKDNYTDKEISLPRIHVYGFSKAHDPEFDFDEQIKKTMPELGSDVEMRRVRLVAPGKWMLCASFILPYKVAYSKRSPVVYVDT